MPSISERFDWVCLTPEPGNYAFGYYDRCAWDASVSRHLALRMPQQARLPVAGETATVGFVDRATRRFHAVAETEAWCHQQGAMTLWLKHRPDTFIYNDFIPADGAWRPIARVCDTQRGIVGEYDRPIYALSPDGRWGASISFSRIPRRGYSYARAVPDYDRRTPDLDGDGLFVVDMHTGAAHLAASYRQMFAAHQLPYDLEKAYIWLNHAIFNVDSSRVMVLQRRCDDPHSPWPWHTYMFTMRIDGSELQCPLPEIHWRGGGISHQVWGRTPGEILIDANWCGRGHEYVAFDCTRPAFQAQRISLGMGPMGHLIFSPDGQWMAADTYAHDGIQRLALVRVATGEIVEIGRFGHVPETNVVDVRCDLHPRWSADGRVLTVDTIHDGERKIYALETGAVTGA